MYRNQFNDEYDSLYLYFRCIVDDNQEIAKYLFQNIEKNFEFLNKNLKYTLIEIMMKYIDLLKDQKAQMKLIDLINNDYTSNYYSSSYYIRNYYQSAVCNFGSLDNSLYLYLLAQLLKKKIFNYTNTIFLEGKGNRRKIFDTFIEIVKNNFEKNEENKSKYGNIYLYFSSSESNKYFYYLKSIWFTDQKNSPLFYDTLLNYLKDKFGVDNGGEMELFDIVKNFSED